MEGNQHQPQCSLVYLYFGLLDPVFWPCVTSASRLAFGHLFNLPVTCRTPGSPALDLGNRLKSTVHGCTAVLGPCLFAKHCCEHNSLSWLQPMVRTGDAAPLQLASSAECTVQNICFLQHIFLSGRHPRNSSDSSGHSQDHWGVPRSTSAVGACPALFMPRSSVPKAPHPSDIPNHRTNVISLGLCISVRVLDILGKAYGYIRDEKPLRSKKLIKYKCNNNNRWFCCLWPM